jgi:peptidylprolyl isomerase
LPAPTTPQGVIMAKVKDGDTVKVHYTGRLEDGTVFDSSLDREPLSFTLGKGQLIPGFEAAVIGMEVGDNTTARIPSEQAYGPVREDMIARVGKDQLPDGLNPEVGQKLQVPQNDGHVMIVTVTDVDDTHITLDANHPLAGKDLTFEIKLVEVA